MSVTQKLHRLKDQLRKDLLDISKIEEEMEHVELELEKGSRDREEMRIIRKGILNVLEEVLCKQAINIAKVEEGIEKLEAREKENTTKNKGM